MKIKVAKFGGTSMADARAITRSADIVKADKERRYVVVSAPGKRFSQDIKVTDLLYECFHKLEMDGNFDSSFEKIRERFTAIADELRIDLDMEACLDEVRDGMYKYGSTEYFASRGEYLSGRIMAAFLGFAFVDAAEVIAFTSGGEFDAATTRAKLKKKLAGVKYAVIPGFYGADDSGLIHTFSRGGSDITGALIAEAVNAELYENWTDVNGFLTADPRIVDHPSGIRELSYRELRELAYMGANVLHPESIFPVRAGGIPINIRNTFEPENNGTMIVPEITDSRRGNTITGIAGKKGYSIIYIEKSMMNSEIGFARKVLSVLEYYNIGFEHMPSGIDTLSIVVADSEIAGRQEVVLDKIQKTVNPDHVEIKDGISLIATVGHGMSFKPGTAAKLCGALATAGVNIRMIDQGSSEMNIIVGVATQDYEKAVRAIYKAFE